MNLATWPAVRVRLLPLWHRWRWPGAIGLACLAAAAWVHAMVLPEMREQQARAVDELAQAEHQAARRRHAGAAAESIAPSQRFRAAFAPAGERHDRLAALVSLAALHGMPAPRIDLRWLAGEPLARYEITMSAAAGYADLRAFLSAALAGDPALSLDALQLRRVDAAAAQVEAELRWSLYLRDDAPAAAVPASAVRSGAPVRAESSRVFRIDPLSPWERVGVRAAEGAAPGDFGAPRSPSPQPSPQRGEGVVEGRLEKLSSSESTAVRAEPVEASGVLPAALRQAPCERPGRARCADGLASASTDTTARLP